MKPVLIYDGDCGFCKKWINRWSEATQDTVDYSPYQTLKNQFPQIPVSAFQSAVQLVEPSGAISSGAEAVFRTFSYSKRHRWFLEFYLRCPGAKPIADAFYKLVATHRSIFSKLTSLFWGQSVQAPIFTLSKIIFTRFLSAIYLIAFLSVWIQIIGLIGSNGILPVAGTIKTVQSQLGASGYWWFPTLCWFNSSDLFLHVICGVGVVLSISLFFLIAPTFILSLLWIFYLSIVTAGREFMSFQWDMLLLETGFLAIFLVPFRLLPIKEHFNETPGAVHFAFKWLLFRLMFSSGMVKLASGDPVWHDLTALSFHYETQPLPPWTAWHMHHLPLWFHQASAVVMFAIELILPFFLFLPRRIRHFSCAGIIFFMVLIIVTGNYSFFNLLTIALACLMVDDTVWRRILKTTATLSLESTRKTQFLWNRWVAIPACLILMTLSLVPMSRLLFHVRMPDPLMKLYSAVTPFGIVNHYGLFAVMTKNRPEIVAEGSNDGVDWKEYEFKYKIGNLQKRPRFAAPHQPRLDWQMWFAALGSYRQNSWFINFCIRLLEGNPAVLKLIERNPFPEKPPEMIRAVIYEYQFADKTARNETGVWWKRDYKGIYLPELSLKS